MRLNLEIPNNQKIILHLCAKEGSDTLPYREAGYDVRIVGEDIGVENYYPPENVYGIIANPPCTHFSTARTTAKTPRDLREGMRLVEECLRIIWECQYKIIGTQRKSPLKFWALENPGTGMLKNFLGNPVFQYAQHEYGGGLRKGQPYGDCSTFRKGRYFLMNCQQAQHWGKKMNLLFTIKLEA